MLPQETIRAKRDGHALTGEQIAGFVRGLVDGSWTEGQAAALAMAICLRGMSEAETTQLALGFRDSGTVLRWDGQRLGGPVLDKHSTGGVGDKVSLVLAPVVAACGGFVPMISGRGLGHTGGTLDKLDSIPGYRSQPDLRALRATVRAVGCAIVGQTADLAPADRRLYAIRDVTGTVESVPLITASILGKKLAAGLDGLVMDVKLGNGAFASTPAFARGLARRLERVARQAGLPTRALMTDMNQVLGRTCGNALEVREAIDCLAGREREPRLLQVIRDLSAELLALGGLAPSRERARERVDDALDSGRALERFARMVAALGGPSDLVERPDRHLACAPVRLDVGAPRGGWIRGMATRDIGLVVVELGGGRRAVSDRIDHRVGLSGVRALGTRVERGDALCTVHAADAAAARRAAQRLQALFELSEHPPA